MGNEFIVPLTIQDISSSIILGNAPAQSVFLYTRNHNIKLKQTVEIDLVLDRGLDNFIPLVTPSPITDGDTVLTAFEKIQAYFNTGIGFEIDPLFSAWITTTPPAYPGDNISTFTNDLGFITCADVPTCETDPIFSAWLITTPPLYSETDPVFNAWLLTNPLASFITCGDVPLCETDPVFSAWLIATPPLYSVLTDGITITGDGVTTPLVAVGGGGVTTFIALTDTPASYNTFGGYLVAVNVGETALEFIAKPVSSDYDHNSLTNSHNLTTDIDHNSLTNTHGPLPTNTSDLVNDSGFITCLDVSACETDPIFSAWLLATPPLYSESDPVFTTWLSTTPPLFSGDNISELINNSGYITDTLTHSNTKHSTALVGENGVIDAMTLKATLVDADVIVIEDSEDLVGGLKKPKKSFWSTVKSQLLSYFNSEYFRVDQTSEQTFINGNPKINRTISEVADDPKNIATVEFVNMAVQSLHLDEYFATTASDIGGIYKVMTETPAAAGTVVSAAITSNTTTNIFNFATVVDSPHLDRLFAGNYDIHAHLLKTGNRGITCYCELYVRSGVTETLVGTSSTTPSLTTIDAFYDLYLNIPTEIPLLTSDRLVLKWYAISVNPAGNTTVTMTVGGTADPHISIDVESTELDRIFAYKELTNVDISGLTEETTPDDDDILLLQKDSDGSIKKVKKSNIGGGGGSHKAIHTQLYNYFNH